MDSIKIKVTIGGEFPIAFEGESALFAGFPGDNLERQGLGFWLQNWRRAGSGNSYHNSSLFIPWANCLSVEIKPAPEGKK